MSNDLLSLTATKAVRLIHDGKLRPEARSSIPKGYTSHPVGFQIDCTNNQKKLHANDLGERSDEWHRQADGCGLRARP
jgi:hypothetical protein